jgi:DNA-binding NtrC family response regulator
MTESQAPSILVVDDEADQVSLMCARLDRRGYVARGANTASQALQLLESGSFDLVLCDIHLGSANGLDVLLRCRAQGLRIPFVFVSGSIDMARHREEVGSDDSVDFLQKPVDFQELLGVLKARVGPHA